jgi:hypothetical protein
MKKRGRKKTGLRPQEYEHRVGVVIEALKHALSGAELLTTFMLEQQGPEWSKQGFRAKQAQKEFRRACTWLSRIDRH